MIPGVGEKTKLKLLRKFKSINRIKGLTVLEIANEIGNSKAKKIKEYLNDEN